MLKQAESTTKRDRTVNVLGILEEGIEITTDYSGMEFPREVCRQMQYGLDQTTMNHGTKAPHTFQIWTIGLMMRKFSTTPKPMIT